MKLSIPVKAALLAGVILAVVGPLQLALVASWSEAERTPLRIALVFVTPYPVYVTASWLFARTIVHGRTRRLTAVLDAIGEGNLRGELPPAIDSDLAVVRDALIGMRRALDELTTRLRHTDAQRRRLFADLAHELATPATTILGIADALDDAAISDDATARARIGQALGAETARLGRLVGDIRDLARLDDPDVELVFGDVALGELVHAVVGRQALGATPRAIEVAVAGDLPAVRADAARVEQVVANLVTNARRYTPPDSPIRVAVARAGAGVELVVEDGGEGVPDDALARLGERLFRVDPSRTAKTGGSGLGLAIVAAIVQRHDGTLRFERAALGGLRVVVGLPGADP